MGLFSFLKNAGAKLFNKGGNEPETVIPTLEELNLEKARLLKQEIERLGLPVEALEVEVDQDKVTLGGTVTTQADKEKLVLVAGNIEGIATVDDQLVVKKEQPAAVFYEVKSGDSLSKIAKSYYGDPMKYQAIFEANKPMLKDPNLIYPGQMLRIPSLEEK